MTSFVTHPDNQKRLAFLKEHLPQSLLLTGEQGMGLLTAARAIADKQRVAELHPQDNKGQIDSRNGTISVEMIRNLYDKTRAKHTSRQIIIIDDADRMSLGAQSAFLKLLEEPNSHSYFILTAHTPGKLLPTILSRVQRITLRLATSAQTAKFIEDLGIKDATKKAQLLFIANGLPAEVSRLATDSNYFTERAKLMADARTFLQADQYQQLLTVQRYQSDKAAALLLIDSALLVARRSLSAKPQAALVKQLEKLLSIQANIQDNHNARLQLARFVL